jgi:DNA-binding transcriptional ArsR family regulator
MLARQGPRLVTLHTRILALLARRPTMSQERLARELEVTMRTVQRHLAELEDGGYMTVNREKRPFRYDVDWARPWPDVPWLRLIALHPGVVGAFSGLSDLCMRTYEEAETAGQDTSSALASMLDESPAAVQTR